MKWTKLYIDNPPNKVTSKRGFSIYPTPTECDTIKGTVYNRPNSMQRAQSYVEAIDNFI